MVEALREIGGQRTVERRYYLTSLPLGVETFARAVRGHWGVENKLHWVLDVCFREDQSRARARYPGFPEALRVGRQGLAVVRNKHGLV